MQAHIGQVQPQQPCLHPQEGECAHDDAGKGLWVVGSHDAGHLLLQVGVCQPGGALACRGSEGLQGQGEGTQGVHQVGEVQRSQALTLHVDTMCVSEQVSQQLGTEDE